jgi:hypothetical protein
MDIECLVAKHQKEAGEELWDKISPMIEKSTRVLVLYTCYAPQSKWMEREMHIARTFKKKFIPVKEDNVELPSVLKGEDREYIPFRRNDPITSLSEICHDVYERRLKTPHVVIFVRYQNPTGQRLLVFLKTRKAYWMNDYWDDQVTKGKIQASYIELPYNCDQSTWAQMVGLEIISGAPKPEELGLE